MAEHPEDTRTFDTRPHGGLSPAEELRQSIGAGRPVRRGGDESAAQGDSWGEDRQLPAELLYELLARPADGLKPRAAVLIGLRITGCLNIEAAELQGPLIAHNCHFDMPVNLIAANAPEISLTACHLPGLAADRLETHGDLDLSEATLAVIGLLGAHIGGQLDVSGAVLGSGTYPPDFKGQTLRPPEAPVGKFERVALVADGMQVDHDMFCREEFVAEGEVRLLGAHIGGTLDFDGATLRGGLSAEGVQVDRGMFCREGFTTEGEVNLIGAHIGGTLYFDRATLPGGLNAEGVQVDQGMFCTSGFTAEGEVRLLGAHIGGQLGFDGATLRGGLNADGVQVDRDMFCQTDFAEGEVRLPGAHIGGQLGFDGATLRGGLTGDGLQVDQDMFCRADFAAEGEVSLVSGHIGGQLSFDGATLTQGLDAETLRVDQGMFCTGDFAAEGEVNLIGAHIGQLMFNGATLREGLNANGLQVDQGMFCTNGFTSEGEVNLIGAHIGQLAFNGATLREGLNADILQVDRDMHCREGFTAEGTLRLLGAHIGGQLYFHGATLREGLNAEGVQVDQGMFCTNGFTSEGEVSLVSGHIGGQLSFDGATLTQGLDAETLRVDQGMFCTGDFAAEGEVRLVSGHIGGQLSFEGATLTESLDAYNLRVDQGMFCTGGFVAGGEVNLIGAHIGQLAFDGATLRRGLNANGLQVDREMHCGEGFTTEGEVSLLGGHIGGQLSFDGATLADPALALDLEGARVDSEAHLRFAERPRGLVDFTRARLGRLFDSEETWPMRLWLRGCEYAGVEATEDAGQGAGRVEGNANGVGWVRRRLSLGGPHDVQRRLRWIRLAEEDRGERGAGYAPSPYTQLMAFYRQEGRDGDARRVAYERERRRKGELGPLGRAWNAFLQWTVGYGYKPLRALLILVALVLAGSLVFSSFHKDGELTAAVDDPPPFVASIYTLDRLIPILSFGLDDAFAPSGAAQWWAFAYTLLGWVLTVAVVAGVTAAVRRD